MVVLLAKLSALQNTLVDVLKQTLYLGRFSTVEKLKITIRLIGTIPASSS